MFHIKYLLIALAVAAADAWELAHLPFKEFEVSSVANKTMCPIRMEINDDPTRTPRHIKYLMCDDQPNALCTDTQTQSSFGCCKKKHNNYRAECVEIYFFVNVSYKDRGQQTIKVPVGCNCLLTKHVEAPEVPSRRKDSPDPQ